MRTKRNLLIVVAAIGTLLVVIALVGRFDVASFHRAGMSEAEQSDLHTGEPGDAANRPAPTDGEPAPRAFAIDVELDADEVCAGRDVMVTAALHPEPVGDVPIFRIGASTGNPAIVRVQQPGRMSIPVQASIRGRVVARSTTAVEVVPCSTDERILLIGKRLGRSRVQARIPLARGIPAGAVYRVDFGDGEAIETSERQVEHTYFEPENGTAQTHILSATVIAESGEMLRARTQFLVLGGRRQAADSAVESARIRAHKQAAQDALWDDVHYRELE